MKNPIPKPPLAVEDPSRSVFSSLFSKVFSFANEASPYKSSFEIPKASVVSHKDNSFSKMNDNLSLR